MSSRNEVEGVKTMRGFLEVLEKVLGSQYVAAIIKVIFPVVKHGCVVFVSIIMEGIIAYETGRLFPNPDLLIQWLNMISTSWNILYIVIAAYFEIKKKEW